MSSHVIYCFGRRYAAFSLEKGGLGNPPREGGRVTLRPYAIGREGREGRGADLLVWKMDEVDQPGFSLSASYLLYRARALGKRVHLSANN